MTTMTPVQEEQTPAAAPGAVSVSESTSAGPARPPQARAVEQATSTPEVPEPEPAPRYTLLEPPDYGSVIGGVPPSPFVSIFLLAGLIALIVAVVGTSAGADMTQVWALGAMLVIVAVFLASFVSRAA